MKRRIVLFGAGGHAKVVLDALEASGKAPERIYDDNRSLWGTSCQGCKVVGGIRELYTLDREQYSVVIAIARNDVRSRLAGELAAKGIALVGVRHPSAVISKHADVAETAHVMAGVVVNPNAQVDDHAVLNTGSIIEHDCRIGRFAHIGPGARLAGAVKVMEGAFVCTGASIIPFCEIGAWATVGAGAAVTINVPSGVTVAGVPARALPKERT